MEGRPPFEPDDLDFDFESARQKKWERETGERPIERPPDRPPADEPPSTERPYDTGEDPYDTGERRHGTGETPAHDTGDASYGTGETPAYETGETGYDTGESAYETGEDPFDTGERRRRREPKRRFRIGRRRNRDRRERPVTGEHQLQDDPYTPAEVPVAGTRRSRHRDLPAKVRRRQAGLAIAVVVAVLIGIVLLARAVFGGGGGDEEQPLPLKKLVGQTIIGKLGKADPDRDVLRRVRKGQIGGFIATAPQDAETLNQQVATLQQAAKDGGNPPLLIMIDQEGGEVERLDGPPNSSAPEMGEAGDSGAAQSEGEDTGNFLKTAGVNVDLAPVLDVTRPATADSIAERSFGDDPAVVSEVGAGFIVGLQSTGVAATAKHFPGLGPATLNTDDAPVTIAASEETLQEALQPFQAAVDAKVELVMVSSAIYPGYGPENPTDPNRPANSVKAIVQGLLRDQLGFQGLIITDDLQSVAIETLTTSPIAGVAALGAGCDLLLFAGSNRGSEDGFDAVVQAAKKKTLSREELQAAYDRITDLKSRLGSSS
jgi:beta-N-acetylhexosaminidase